jgi:hypothetical protein
MKLNSELRGLLALFGAVKRLAADATPVTGASGGRVRAGFAQQSLSADGERAHLQGTRVATVQ